MWIGEGARRHPAQRWVWRMIRRVVAVLHVIIPVFNEPRTLRPCVERVVAAPLPAGWSMQLVIVDDHSETPGKRAAVAVAAELAGRGVAHRLIRHRVNLGKGAALQTGFDAVLDGGGGSAGGDGADRNGAADDDVVIIQDADLEYDPGDYAALLEPIVAGRTGVVYGTRWGGHRRLTSVTSRVHALGNRVLTLLSNAMTGYRLHDMECCYKLMTVAVLRRVRPMLTESRFGIEPQVTAALGRLGAWIEEVPVGYDPRGFDAGKKIGWMDGVRTMYVIMRERLRRG